MPIPHDVEKGQKIALEFLSRHVRRRDNGVGHLGVGGRQRWPVPSSSLPLPACLGLDWIAPASGNCARIRYVAPICFEFVAVSSDGLRLHGLRLRGLRLRGPRLRGRAHHASRFRGSD